jgi:hypothetical protein
MDTEGQMIKDYNEYNLKIYNFSQTEPNIVSKPSFSKIFPRNSFKLDNDPNVLSIESFHKLSPTGGKFILTYFESFSTYYLLTLKGCKEVIFEKMDMKGELWKKPDDDLTSSEIKANLENCFLTGEGLQKLFQDQENDPYLLGEKYVKEEENYYLFQNNFYLVKNEVFFSTDDLKALILSKHLKEKKKIERAKSIVATKNLGVTREAIPDDVKQFVWRRDGGQCVKCGSKEWLEFDHIIPLAMGGSNSARNLQILCEKCNREKGGNLL